MNDYLLEIGQNKATRKIASGIGLPVPEKLQRSKEPWSNSDLSGHRCLVSGKGSLHSYIAQAIGKMGGQIYCQLPQQDFEDSYGRVGDKASFLGEGDKAPPVNSLVFDATHIKHPSELSQLYQFFHHHIRTLKKNGRIIVIGKPFQEEEDVEAAATFRALEGFVRSCAKEVGRKGSTGILITVESNPTAQNRLEPVLAFLLSNRSSFISGQVFRVTGSVPSDGLLDLNRSLKGKVALVTGAARGIGAATVRSLSNEGATVICLDRPNDEDLLSKVALDNGAHVLPLDLMEQHAEQKIQEFVVQNFGGIDIVINNAGITRDKTLAKMASDHWNSAMQVNLISVINICSTLLTKGLRDGGRAVCLSSIAGIAGNFGQTNYSASKAGIIGFVKSLSQQVAKRGITVNAIAPGFIETRLTQAIPFITREAGRRLSNVSQGGLPGDIANAITFLASPGGVGINGEVIRVCGGSLIGA